MKTRNREINIFSMSALDLFASALGAFILIAVVLFPYFPNTGDSPERVADIKKVLEQEKKEHEQTKKELEKKTKEAAEAKKFKLPNIDIVIAVDVTGSMGKVIDGLKQEFTSMTRLLSKLAPSVGFGIVAFGDRAWNQELFTHRLTEISKSPGNMTALKGFIDSMSTNMGLGSGSNEDDPEALGSALKTSVGMPWRAQAEKRIIVIITDNAAYPEEQESVLAMARNFAARNGQQVSTVFVRSTGRAHGRDYLRRLAEAGKGQAVSGGGSVTASILESLL